MLSEVAEVNKKLMKSSQTKMRKRQIRHQKYAYRQKDGYRCEQVGVLYILMQTVNRDRLVYFLIEEMWRILRSIEIESYRSSCDTYK